MWDDGLRMAGCWLAVAAVAVPVGAAGWVFARDPVMPRPRPWRVGWSGFDVIVAFLLLNAAVPGLALEAVTRSEWLPDDGSARGRAVRALWVGMLAFPVQVAVLVSAWALFDTGQSRAVRDARVVPGRVALGVLVWAGLTPAVLLVHAGVSLLFRELGWETQGHPLSELSDGPFGLGVLFLFQAGVAAPVVEELLFRGVLLGWLVGGRALVPAEATGPRPAADRGAWVVLTIGVAFAAASTPPPIDLTRGPVLFAVGLAAGWVVLRQVFRRKRRTLGAVYASAALFAEVHSAVWPSPVPLFVLGLGLGWLAVRTRGVLGPIIVHGLFNAVSVLFVLRGGS